jgi:hypothetical protein
MENKSNRNRPIEPNTMSSKKSWFQYDNSKHSWFGCGNSENPDTRRFNRSVKIAVIVFALIESLILLPIIYFKLFR